MKMTNLKIHEGVPSFDDRLISAREAAAVLKIGLTKWWEGVKEGQYPKPIKLGPRSTRWSMRAVENLMTVGVCGSQDRNSRGQ